MPVRTRKKKVVEETTIRTRNRKVYKEQKQVLPQNGRLHDEEEDEYYYIAFLWRNTVDDFQDTVDLLRSKNLPFEWAKSPSNCMSFRILRTEADARPELKKPPGKKYSRPCTAFMPYSCYGREQLWQMEDTNGFPFLYKDWTPVLTPIRRRRRRG